MIGVLCCSHSHKTLVGEIGTNKVVLLVHATDILAANTMLYGIVSPVAGTITQAGSAIGNKDDVTPSAANVVVVGDEIQLYSRCQRRAKRKR